MSLKMKLQQLFCPYRHRGAEPEMSGPIDARVYSIVCPYCGYTKPISQVEYCNRIHPDEAYADRKSIARKCHAPKATP